MKKTLSILTILTFLFSIVFEASALEVKIKGSGGVVWVDGTLYICPNPSQNDCATIVISGTEIKDIIVNRGANGMMVENLLKEYDVIIANSEILGQQAPQGSDLILILEKKR